MKFSSLISEDSKNLSLGRVSFWIVFGISIYFWFRREPDKFPETLFYSFMLLLLYNISKKGFDSINRFFELKLDQKLGILKNIVSNNDESKKEK